MDFYARLFVWALGAELSVLSLLTKEEDEDGGWFMYHRTGSRGLVP